LRYPSPAEDGAKLAPSFEQSRLFGTIGLAIVGLALGIGIGLFVAWGLWPVELINADPSDLRLQHKEEYVRMISQAYVADGDLDAAKVRLNQLGSASYSKIFGDLISNEKGGGGDQITLDALVRLAQALGLNSIPLVDASNTSTIPIASRPRFRLAERTMLTCVDAPDEAYLQVSVRDQRGRDLPNVAVGIHWASGEDTLYTGLKPEHGNGFADFQAASTTYSVTIQNAQSDVAENLMVGETPANCRNDRGATPRGWKLVFQQR
jgi:hypothetical protein